MKLGETIVYLIVLIVYPCVEASLCSLGVSSGFGGRAEFEVSTGHIFSSGALSAAILVECKAGVREA